MAAVLRSPMAGLTDEELAVLRLEDGSVPFHEAVLELAEGLYEEDGQKEISDSEADSEADQKQGRNADEKTENHIAIDVCSHSVEESLAFVVAAILQCGDDNLKNRVVIAKDNETTGLLASQCSNMVIISSGDDKNINPNENCLVYVSFRQEGRFRAHRQL